MGKADLLETVRCELGLILQDAKSKNECYDRVIQVLKAYIPHYKTILMYLTNETSFQYYKHEGNVEGMNLEAIPFGEGMLSNVAARGEISCEFEPSGQLIFIPFYHGHHLVGELLIKTTQYVDQEEICFIKYIQKILNQVPIV
ncbi:hypothetical protein [Tepidibacillus sp. HK-1]|uniref:hypothetical protein n=1 Tax=Tepidibacillus sp. HK-1 TaxID=1883407 RepID=UPI0008530740|nr:hypothetical protein [Tepidibacillus sp. HK-1]GBF11089.1 hypothetical protein HK1_01107 [Tepidibacillus sp. HK-1]